MFGTEVDKIRDSYVKGSFGILIISMFLEIAIPILIRIDKQLRFPKDGALKEARRQLRRRGTPELSESALSSNRETSKRLKVDSLDAEKKFEPKQLSASELAERFPPYEFDNLGYYPPVSMKTSASSLTGGRTNSIGSAHSLQTQSTVVTGVSYDPKYSDVSSVESLV